MDKEYIEMLQRYEELERSGHLDSNDMDLMCSLLDQNSFENCLDRKTAEKLIKYMQDIDLDQFGGWALWDEVSFKVDGQRYAVIAWGSNNYEILGENKGEDALQGMIFIKEG